MTWEILILLLILAGALWLFATERLPVDLVAVLVLCLLLVTGLVTPEEGISGLSHPATVTVAAMFILSAGLAKTGAVNQIGSLLVRAGRTPSLLLLVVMLTAGGISAFINNTAAVAVFLPLVLTAAATRRVSTSRVLIPLSFASQFGGVCTLIGTSTNLLVSGIAVQAGVAEFSMFEFGKLGVILLIIGVTFILATGRWLLPAQRKSELTEQYQLREYVTELRVMANSPLLGKTLRQSRLGELHDITVLEILRRKQKIWSILDEPVQEGDILLARGPVKNLMDCRLAQKLELEPEFQLRDATLQDDHQRLLEVLVAPASRLQGRTLADLQFRWRFNAIVLAIQRRGHVLREKLANVPLRVGDALLLLVANGEVRHLQATPSIIVLGDMERLATRPRRAPWAIAIVGLVVALAALEVWPILVGALIGCAALVLTRCLPWEQVYEAIDWKVIILLAGVLPLGLAMQKTGAAVLIADGLLKVLGDFGPIAVLAGLYLITAVLTELMSNNASAALLAPIAISTAAEMGVDPKPFLMAIAFAASTSFATPVGYQTNAMVYSAGGYRFTDFTKIGIPLNLLFWAVSVYFIPKFWPL